LADGPEMKVSGRTESSVEIAAGAPPTMSWSSIDRGSGGGAAVSRGAVRSCASRHRG
jgi:hypothetical protein